MTTSLQIPPYHIVSMCRVDFFSIMGDIKVAVTGFGSVSMSISPKYHQAANKILEELIHTHNSVATRDRLYVDMYLTFNVQSPTRDLYKHLVSEIEHNHRAIIIRDVRLSEYDDGI